MNRGNDDAHRARAGLCPDADPELCTNGSNRRMCPPAIRDHTEDEFVPGQYVTGLGAGIIIPATIKANGVYANDYIPHVLNH